MKHYLYLIVLLCLGAVSCPGIAISSDDTTSPVDISALLDGMTLREKLGQLTMSAGGWNDTGPDVPLPGRDAIRAGEIGAYLGVHGARKTRELQDIAVNQSRLGIPLLFAYDVIHGFRTLSPMPMTEAASWNLQAIEHSARLAAREASAHGLHWTFAPMVDISRDPRWGRVVEGAGEDAFLGAEIAAARVRGFQGDDLSAAHTLLATAKHFVAYGAAEGGRDYNTADLSERTLRELHFPPFAAAIDAGVGSLMPAFNEVNGVPVHASRRLLTDVLRSEWGFQGVVVSDYNAIRELMAHGTAGSPEEAGRRALQAGVDIDMVSGIFARDVADWLEPVHDGNEPATQQQTSGIDTIDQAVMRVLETKQALGLFHDPYRYSDVEREQRHTLTPAHRTAVRALAGESIVMLENRNEALPVSPDIATLAVIGPLANSPGALLGGWSMAGRAQETRSVLDAIGRAVSSATRVLHTRGVDVRSKDEAGIEAAVAMASQADAVVLVLGETPDMSSEANNRTSLALPGAQRALAQAVEAVGKPVITVLVHGRPLATPWLAEHSDALLDAGFPGTEGADAIADVLTGRVNPSGKLVMSIPRNVGQVPVYYNHRSTGRPADPSKPYRTGYIDSPVTPLYPFGFGLGYSPFEYADLQLSEERLAPDGVLEISATITNAGDHAGQEVVQLYVRDPVASVARPVRELKGFEKVGLQPGKSAQVTFSISAEDLSFYDEDLRRVAEAGSFEVFVAPSSEADAGLNARFVLTDDWRPSKAASILHHRY